MSKNDKTLEELLANSPKESFSLNDEDREWLSSTVGLEKLGSLSLNDGHLVEALDRTRICIEFIELSLANHSLINANPELNGRVVKISDQLEDLYQTLGAIEDVDSI